MFKDIAVKRIPALNDLSFLSSIETSQRENGIYGGYELAQRIQDDMQNSLSQETQKDKQELINRLAAIKDNDVKFNRNILDRFILNLNVLQREYIIKMS